MDHEQLDIFSFLDLLENEKEDVSEEFIEESFDFSVFEENGYSLEQIEQLDYSDYSWKNLTEDELVTIINSTGRSQNTLREIPQLDDEYLPTNNLRHGRITYQNIISPENMLKFLRRENILSGREHEILEKYDIDLKYKEHYKPTFLVEAFEELPLINLHESKKKLINTVYTVVNYLFEDFYVKEVDGKISIIFPKELFKETDRLFELFEKPLDFYEKLRPEYYPLYFLIRPYMELSHFPSSYYSTRKNTIAWIHGVLASETVFETNEEEDYLELKFDIDDLMSNAWLDTYMYNENVKRDVYSELKSLYNIINPLYMLMDVSNTLVEEAERIERETLRERIIDATRARENFLESLDSRLIPIENLNHKTAVREAEKLGMTHFFIPFSNKNFTFPKGTELLIHKSDEWELLPPDPFLVESSNINYGGIRSYHSYYEEHPFLATRHAPHLMGKELLNAHLDEEEFSTIFDYLFKDYEHYDSFKNTQKIIEKYPLVHKRLTDLTTVSVDELEQKSEVDTFNEIFSLDEPLDIDLTDDILEQMIIEGGEEPIEKGETVMIEGTIYRFANYFIDSEENVIGTFEPLISSEGSVIVSQMTSLRIEEVTDSEFDKMEERFFETKFLSFVKSTGPGIGLNTSVFIDTYSDKMYFYLKGELVKVVTSDEQVTKKLAAKKIYELIDDNELSGINFPFLFPFGKINSRDWTVEKSNHTLSLEIGSHSYIYLFEDIDDTMALFS